MTLLIYGALALTNATVKLFAFTNITSIISGLLPKYLFIVGNFTADANSYLEVVNVSGNSPAIYVGGDVFLAGMHF